jgi:tRNA(fMet)-specific endonuclease VapC
MLYLLDTNVVIALFAGEPSVVQAVRDAEVASKLRVPTIVLGELYYGARKSSKPIENTARVDALESRAAVLGCDAGTSREYGKIKESLRARGRPIPDNDIWIAALALQHDLNLVTRDSHFQEVDSLAFVNW